MPTVTLYLYEINLETWLSLLPRVQPIWWITGLSQKPDARPHMVTYTQRAAQQHMPQSSDFHWYNSTLDINYTVLTRQMKHNLSRWNHQAFPSHPKWMWLKQVSLQILISDPDIFPTVCLKVVWSNWKVIVFFGNKGSLGKHFKCSSCWHRKRRLLLSMDILPEI